MKLVQTLVVRDEADIVGAQIDYHLSAGVDFVIASDHESVDGTTEVLESYARDGVLRRIPVSGGMRDGPWRTHMARLAATEHGADWVINTDADEFWMPSEGTLKDVLAAVREPWGVVYALSRHFVPRPDDGALFAERMTVRVSPEAPINDPTSPYRPHLKAAHRADPEITVSFGSHTVASRLWRAVHNWHPADVLHFPFRSLEQWENKGVRRARGDKPLGQYLTALRASEGGRSADRFHALVVDDATLEKGRAAGWLVTDNRVRDALRALRGIGDESRPVTVDHGRLSESAAVSEADLVRLQRFLDGLAVRVSALHDGTRRAAR
jgi:Glycosyl transferase family 2